MYFFCCGSFHFLTPLAITGGVLTTQTALALRPHGASAPASVLMQRCVDGWNFAKNRFAQVILGYTQAIGVQEHPSSSTSLGWSPNCKSNADPGMPWPFYFFGRWKEDGWRWVKEAENSLACSQLWGRADLWVSETLCLLQGWARCITGVAKGFIWWEEWFVR